MVVMRWLGILGLWGASMPMFGQEEGRWRVQGPSDAQIEAQAGVEVRADVEDWAREGWFTDGLAERYQWYLLLLANRGQLHAEPPEASRARRDRANRSPVQRPPEQRPPEAQGVRPPHWRARSAARKASKAQRRQPLDYVVEKAGIDVSMTFEVWHGAFR